MSFRLSTKLAAKLNVTSSKALPVDENPFADWSGHVFTAEAANDELDSSPLQRMGRWPVELGREGDGLVPFS